MRGVLSSMSLTQWVETTTPVGPGPLKEQRWNPIQSMKGYHDFTGIKSDKDLKVSASSHPNTHTHTHTQMVINTREIRYKGMCVCVCVCERENVWEGEREKSPVLLSKIAIINAEHRTGYRWLPCTDNPPWVSALINSHFIESALHHDCACVAELVCGNTLQSPFSPHIKRGKSVGKDDLRC